MIDVPQRKSRPRSTAMYSVSIGSFRVALILSKAGIFGHICGLGECRGCTKALSLFCIIHQQAPLRIFTEFQVLYLSKLMHTNYFNY